MAIEVLIGLNLKQKDGSEIRIEPGGKMERWTRGEDGAFKTSPFSGSLESVLPADMVSHLLANFNPPPIRIVEESKKVAPPPVDEPEHAEEES